MAQLATSKNACEASLLSGNRLAENSKRANGANSNESRYVTSAVMRSHPVMALNIGDRQAPGRSGSRQLATVNCFDFSVGSIFVTNPWEFGVEGVTKCRRVNAFR